MYHGACESWRGGGRGDEETRTEAGGVSKAGGGGDVFDPERKSAAFYMHTQLN